MLEVLIIQLVLPTTVRSAHRWINYLQKLGERHPSYIICSRPVKIVLCDRSMRMHKLAGNISLILVNLGCQHNPPVAVKQYGCVIIRFDGSTYLSCCRRGGECMVGNEVFLVIAQSLRFMDAVVIGSK